MKGSTKRSPKRNTKSADFFERFARDQSMVEYFTRLSILNPAADARRGLNEPRREGSFVRLAHAREEFTAPIILKGKSVAKAVRRKSPKKKKLVKTKVTRG